MLIRPMTELPEIPGVYNLYVPAVDMKISHSLVHCNEVLNWFSKWDGEQWCLVDGNIDSAEHQNTKSLDCYNPDSRVKGWHPAPVKQLTEKKVEQCLNAPMLARDMAGVLQSLMLVPAVDPKPLPKQRHWTDIYPDDSHQVAPMFGTAAWIKE